MDPCATKWNPDEQLHYLRTISEVVAMPHFACQNRDCRRRMKCCGPSGGNSPVCFSSLRKRMFEPTRTFAHTVYQLRAAFLLKPGETEALTKLDPLQMALAESAIRALIPRRRWKELRRWLISLGVDQELLIVKSASTGF